MENLDSILQGNCIPIYEIDVRILNHPNWTSIAQVMVRFPGTTTGCPVLAEPIVQICRTGFRLGKSENLD